MRYENHIKKAAQEVAAMLLVTLIHYWITFTAAALLQTIASLLAYIERGYFAMGGEIFVFPLVYYIGYRLTPRMYFRITERGIEYHVRKRKHRVYRNQAGTRSTRVHAHQRAV